MENISPALLEWFYKNRRSLKAKMLRKRKAIESQIEMIEIASPNKQCIENKQRNVL